MSYQNFLYWTHRVGRSLTLTEIFLMRNSKKGFITSESRKYLYKMEPPLNNAQVKTETQTAMKMQKMKISSILLTIILRATKFASRHHHFIIPSSRIGQ